MPTLLATYSSRHDAEDTIFGMVHALSPLQNVLAYFV